jgi:cytochrome c biogenesis protein CcmG, thiol:disulfide interchange protein DsbE
MATTKPKPKPKSRAVAAARKKQPPWLWIGVVALVLILAVAAIVSGGGSDGNKTAEGSEQSRPVTISGSALPQLPQSGGTDPAVGQVIPEATGQSFDGSPVAIRNDGRAKLIVFVAHWCPHCQKEIPLLADWLKSNSLPSGVDLYTVSTGVDSKRPNYPPSSWLDEEGWKAPTLADAKDGKAADAYGLSAFPYFVAVDGSGKVVARTTGEITTDDFEDLAMKALGNR